MWSTVLSGRPISVAGRGHSPRSGVRIFPTSSATATRTARHIFDVTSFGATLIEDTPASGLWGSVIATFQRSCYVLGANGGVMCVADNSLVDGPVMLRVGFPEPQYVDALGVRTGMPLLVEDGDLRLSPGILLRMSSARPWTPPVVKRLAPPEAILDCLSSLAAGLASAAPGDGLAPLVGCAEDLANERPVRAGRVSRVIHAALPGLRQLVMGLRTHNALAIDRGVERLIGLGPGLTPSGDDLLGGMMVGRMRTLGARSGDSDGPYASPCCPNEQGTIEAMADGIRRHAANRTTAISAGLLRHAAQGVGSAPVHHLVQLVSGTASPAQSTAAALAGAGAGHTSGWDCLAGLFLGMHIGLSGECGCRSHRPRPRAV